MFEFCSVEREDALRRLNLGREYEDQLVLDLDGYFLDCIDGIPDVGDSEKEKIKLSLKRILEDSRRHSMLFTQMIDMVIESGNDNF
jgi:hypothetical protein